MTHSITPRVLLIFVALCFFSRPTSGNIRLPKTNLSWILEKEIVPVSLRIVLDMSHESLVETISFPDDKPKDIVIVPVPPAITRGDISLIPDDHVKQLDERSIGTLFTENLDPYWVPSKKKDRDLAKSNRRSGQSIVHVEPARPAPLCRYSPDVPRESSRQPSDEGMVRLQFSGNGYDMVVFRGAGSKVRSELAKRKIRISEDVAAVVRKIHTAGMDLLVIQPRSYPLQTQIGKKAVQIRMKGCLFYMPVRLGADESYMSVLALTKDYPVGRTSLRSVSIRPPNMGLFAETHINVPRFVVSERDQFFRDMFSHLLRQDNRPTSLKIASSSSLPHCVGSSGCMEAMLRSRHLIALGLKELDQHPPSHLTGRKKLVAERKIREDNSVQFSRFLFRYNNVHAAMPVTFYRDRELEHIQHNWLNIHTRRFDKLRAMIPEGEDMVHSMALIRENWKGVVTNCKRSGPYWAFVNQQRNEAIENYLALTGYHRKDIKRKIRPLPCAHLR